MTLMGADTGWRLDSSTRIYCTLWHRRFTSFYYNGCSFLICWIILPMSIVYFEFLLYSQALRQLGYYSSWTKVCLFFCWVKYFIVREVYFIVLGWWSQFKNWSNGIVLMGMIIQTNWIWKSDFSKVSLLFKYTLISPKIWIFFIHIPFFNNLCTQDHFPNYTHRLPYPSAPTH